MAGINDALDSLLTNTEEFLKNNAVMIYGSNKGTSGIHRFVMQGTDEDGWKSCAGGATRKVPFYVIYKADSFNGKGAGEKSREFTAHYISMREYNVATRAWEDTDTTHYILPSTGDVDIMVTSKLNGCTFGIGSDANGSRLVSHLRPPTQLGDMEARLKLDTGTRAGFAGGKPDVSIMSSTGQNGTVIGRRITGNWKFYAQRYQIFASAVGIIDSVNLYG